MIDPDIKEEQRITKILSSFGELRQTKAWMGGFTAEIVGCRLLDGPGGYLACIGWGDTQFEALTNLYERIRGLDSNSWVVDSKDRRMRLVNDLLALQRDRAAQAS